MHQNHSNHTTSPFEVVPVADDVLFGLERVIFFPRYQKLISRRNITLYTLVKFKVNIKILNLSLSDFGIR